MKFPWLHYLWDFKDSIWSFKYRGAWLFDGTHTRCMNKTSHHISFDSAKALVRRERDAGATIFPTYSFNHGDGVGITSFYQGDKFLGMTDDKKLEHMRKILWYTIRKRGRNSLWFFADDNGNKVPFNDVGALRRHMKLAWDLVGDLCYDSCIGVETDEYLKDVALEKNLVAYAKKLTGRPVGIHYTSLGKWNRAVKSGADVFHGQFGFDNSPATMRTKTSSTLSRLAGMMDFTAWEYHGSSDSHEAKILGDAALGAGAKGAGNGSTK